MLQNQPENKNFLQASKFLLSFKRAPNVQFFCQEVNLPGVMIKPLVRSTPLVELYVPGSKIEYETLDIKFLIDEELASWKEIHDWIRAMAPAKKSTEYNNLKNLASGNSVSDNFPQYSDATLTLLTNLNNPNIRINFVECFPIEISNIQFDTKLDASHILTADASFKFSYYDIETA